MPLTKAEELELIALLELELAERERNKPIWSPNPRKDPDTPSPQETLLSTKAKIVGYGGAAGGGKTFGIIGKALLQHKHSLILRRTFPQFKEISMKFAELVGAENVKADSLIRFKGDKHPQIQAETIELGHLNHPDKDWTNYQGRAKDGQFWDELTNFPVHIFRRLSGWNRPTSKTGIGSEPQVVATFNPPLDAKGLWVIDFFGPWLDEFFVDHDKKPLKAVSGEVLHVAYIENNDYFYREPQTITHHPVTNRELAEPRTTVTRTFIQALLDDNPTYAGSSYESDLQILDEAEYQALRWGKMTSSLKDVIGQIFKTLAYKECRARWTAFNTRGEDGNTNAPDGMPLCLGFDTAQGGDDDNVYIPIWEGGYFGQKGIVNGKSANDAGKLCDWLENEIRTRWNCEPDEIPLSVDAIGGRDFIYEWVRRWPDALVYKFRGSDSAGVRGIFQTHKDQDAKHEAAIINAVSKLPFYTQGVTFLNKISAAYIRLGDATRHPEFRIAFPPDNELQRQLTARTAGNEKNRMAISPKEQFVKEFGKSPNEADAAVMAYWFVDVVVHLILSGKELDRFNEIQRIRCS